ncbi:MAG: Uma2 family endonuclease, partial [bacterium]|nr:Uma2 family endonuclease [bacterium]
MATVLETPERDAVEHDRTAFNLAVWDKICADPELAKLPYRIETDEFGQIIMSPPPAPSHGSKQSRISRHLGNLITHGEVVSECPISTSKGVKAADVAWCSEAIWSEAEKLSCFPKAPEICVEVVSPSNTTGEIEQKKRLYFEAGAKEVWTCSETGAMQFFQHPDKTIPSSDI